MSVKAVPCGEEDWDSGDVKRAVSRLTTFALVEGWFEICHE